MLVGANRGDQAKAVECGHHHVGEDEIGCVVANAIERGTAIADDLDAIVLSEHAAEIVAHIGVVVGDQDAGRRRSTD